MLIDVQTVNWQVFWKMKNYNVKTAKSMLR